MSEAIELSRLTCLADYEAAAARVLPADRWAYLNAGSADGLVAQRNREAFDKLTLLPRMLRQMHQAHTRIELLGRPYPHPLLIAPSAQHALAHPEAETATALAAAAMQTPYIVSCQASTLIEDIAARVPQGERWLQLYLHYPRVALLDLLRRAQSCDFAALVITVDAPLQGLRNEDARAGFVPPAHAAAVNLAAYPAPAETTLAAGQSLLQSPRMAQLPSWEDIAWLASQTSLPIWLKGLLNPLDVPPALDAGVAGLIVSNHGGRTLDAVPASIQALPAVVQAVAGRVPVLMDGGIRRGSDILKALALGADAVLIGRPALHGLAVGGASGVAHVLHLLLRELEHSMVLCGVRSPAEAATAIFASGQ